MSSHADDLITIEQQKLAERQDRYNKFNKQVIYERRGGLFRSERKFYDTSLNTKTLSAPDNAESGEADPSATVLFNTVSQGIGEQQRIGRQIHMESIEIKGVIHTAVQVNQTITDLHPTVQLYLVLDTQTNGLTLKSEDVFINPSGSNIVSTSVLPNLEQKNRFEILIDLKIKLEPLLVVYDGTNIEQSGSHTLFEIFAYLDNRVVNYCGTTSDVANITDNSLHLIAYTSNATQLPQIFYNARLRFNG